MTLPFDLPPLSIGTLNPIWEKGHFYIDQQQTSVLQYSENQTGWNTDLNDFHDEHGGADHFIGLASRRHAIQQIQQYVTQKNPIILEVGCSSGFLLKDMQKSLTNTALLMGSDVIYEPLCKLSKELSNIPLFQFDITRCPLPDHSVDAIVTLNVLEHIENDRVALEQMYRILKPGGILIIEVPAGPALYDIYDKMLMHYRRYSLPNLISLVQKAGFTQILKKSHLGFFLYPPFWLVKKRNQLLFAENIEKQQEQVKKNIQSSRNSRLMHWMMQAELALGEKINYPFGIRCLLTCQKK